ncbi:MAG: hypothetical protein ACRDPF_06270, partial [Streptosporangiaceae bacterium]
MLACGTRIGIPRWLPDAGDTGAGEAGAGDVGAWGSDGGARGADNAGAGPAAVASDGIVIGLVSHGAIGHSASPFRAPGPGPAGPAPT